MVDERPRQERRTELEAAKATLRHLASADPDPATVVDRAAAAVDDLDAAAAFVEDAGVDGLARAVEAADDPAVRARGERALAAFRRFRAAAGDDPPTGHFHRGRGTDLRRDGEAPSP